MTDPQPKLTLCPANAVLMSLDDEISEPGYPSDFVYACC